MASTRCAKPAGPIPGTSDNAIQHSRSLARMARPAGDGPGPTPITRELFRPMLERLVEVVALDVAALVEVGDRAGDARRTVQPAQGEAHLPSTQLQQVQDRAAEPVF